MTSDLAVFENHEIRTIETTVNGEKMVWFPISDLANAWGLDRTTPIKILSRNEEAFQGLLWAAACDNLSPSEQVCVNERGLYLMMGKISTGKLKNREAAAAILRFQRWVPELIQKYRKKEIHQIAPAAPDIKGELQQAKVYADVCGRDAGAFQAAVFRKHGMQEFADALQVPSLIHGEAGQWMNPTDIGIECGGLSARDINRFLYNHDYQYPQGTLWRLTAKGEQFGEEYFFQSTSKHQEIRIRWHRSVLIAAGLKRPVEESQLALPARA
jgi:prophage antirepressor-like protein